MQDATDARIAELRFEGLTQRDIALELGISQAKVSNALNRMGVRSKPGRKPSPNKFRGPIHDTAEEAASAHQEIVDPNKAKLDAIIQKQGYMKILNEHHEAMLKGVHLHTPGVPDGTLMWEGRTYSEQKEYEREQARAKQREEDVIRQAAHTKARLEYEAAVERGDIIEPEEEPWDWPSTPRLEWDDVLEGLPIGRETISTIDAIEDAEQKTLMRIAAGIVFHSMTAPSDRDNTPMMMRLINDTLKRMIESKKPTNLGETACVSDADTV